MRLASRCQESAVRATGKRGLQEELLSHLKLTAGTGNNARILANVTSPFFLASTETNTTFFYLETITALRTLN